QALHPEKVVPASVDITNRKHLVELARGCDVVINEAHAGKLQLLALEAALEAGAHYIDLGTFHDIMKQQLDLDKEFRKARLTAVLGLGSGPGINNVIARYIADKLDSVESVEMSFASTSLTRPSSPLALPYDAGGLWALLTLSPIVFEDGRFVEKPSFYTLYKNGLLEKSQFPDPIGICHLGYLPHVEPHTLPIYLANKAVKSVCVKGAFGADVLEKFGLLIDIGLTSPDPIMIGGVPVVPQQVLASCVSKLPGQEAEPIEYGCTRVRVLGEKDGEGVEYTAEMLSGPYRGLNAVQHRTGHAPAIGARMIHRGVINARGVFPPESGVPAEAFLNELKKRELRVSYTCRSYA
ncbi:MAG TPA: saccharopine dehydrogenase C-terminal domain-containing protein, partial [Blastocatellia bacterium]|nr:saccharopine dehydrogenase C-terminal domain-containing protein [Blastocatellia bacterium]